LRLLASGAAACPLVCGATDLAASTARPAMHFERLAENKIRCLLCPRECVVADRERGTCGVRENRDGTYYTLVHSNPCSLNNDPIEKKPLFHFRPGTQAFSLATAGCNIECRFCQNWQISQFPPEQVNHRVVTPDEIVRHAQRLGSSSIAFTYSEPVVFYEYMLDICKAASGTGIGRVMISNGYINQKPLAELLPHLDGIKIDFKAFTERFYKEQCSAHLKPVLESLEVIRDAGTWLELVVLTIPTLNDDPTEVEAMARWVVQRLGPDTPVHFTRFHPTYKLKNLPPTPVATLERCREISIGQGLRYVYAGNVPGHPGENTYCPSCGTPVIVRDGYRIKKNAITDGACPACKAEIRGVWK
jgi:pyruvate formate lyase activating enzyme